MAELADAADSKSAEAYHLVGVRPPLPAPDLNPFGSFGLWRRFDPEETSTLPEIVILSQIMQ